MKEIGNKDKNGRKKILRNCITNSKMTSFSFLSILYISTPHLTLSNCQTDVTIQLNLSNHLINMQFNFTICQYFNEYINICLC